MNTAGYPVATMVNAKGMVDEQHPNYIGTYWGQVSTAYAAETVESADAYLVAGEELPAGMLPFITVTSRQQHMTSKFGW